GPADGWLSQDALWLVSKTVADKLRAHLLSQGVDGIPSSNTAVFNVLQDHGMLQPTPDGKAIWRATITGENGWSHSFTFLRLSPALVWEADERPEPFAGTVRVDAESDQATDLEANVLRQPSPALDLPQPGAPTSAVSDARQSAAPKLPLVHQDATTDLLALFDSIGESPEPAIAPAEQPQALPPAALTAQDLPPAEEPIQAQPSGQHFVAWLGQGIGDRRLILNDAKALVHTVADAVFLVSPGVFQRYAQEHPQIASWAKQEQVADWQWVQKRFEKLQLHRKQPDGLNIWTCLVTGPRKSRRVHGYMLERQHVAVDLPLHDNPYLSLGKSPPAEC
ncbi:TPA: conjugal transfer nickase/helicase domain-containing protein, partial [Pseudomonas aeruginosa]